MRWIVVVGLVAGCAAPTPVTIVQVPGMTPLPLAQRMISTIYERDDFIRQCGAGITGALTAQGRNLYCGCLIDTMTVYLTLEDLRAHDRKYGKGPTGMERALGERSSVAQVVLACKSQVLGE